MWKAFVDPDVAEFCEPYVHISSLGSAKTADDVYRALVDLRGIIDADTSILDRVLDGPQTLVSQKRPAPPADPAENDPKRPKTDILEDVMNESLRRRREFKPLFSSRWSGETATFFTTVLSAIRQINDAEVTLIHDKDGTIVLEASVRTMVVQCIAVIKGVDMYLAGNPYAVTVSTKTLFDAIAPSGAKAESFKFTHGLDDSLDVNTVLTRSSSNHDHSLGTGMSYVVPSEYDRIDHSILDFKNSNAVQFAFDVLILGLQAMVGETFSITIDGDQMQLKSRSDDARKTFNVPLTSCTDSAWPSGSVTLRIKEVVDPLKKIEKKCSKMAFRMEKNRAEFRAFSSDGNSWISIVAAACVDDID